MKRMSIALAAAAAVLMAGISGASAAGTMSKSSSGSAMQSSQMSKDTLSLTSQQRQTAWNDISKSATPQTAPKSFTAKVGAMVPSTVTTKPVPSKAASDVPALKSYNFAMLQDKILIVNPTDKKVAEVITK